MDSPDVGSREDMIESGKRRKILDGSDFSKDKDRATEHVEDWVDTGDRKHRGSKSRKSGKGEREPRAGRGKGYGGGDERVVDGNGEYSDDEGAGGRGKKRADKLDTSWDIPEEGRSKRKSSKDKRAAKLEKFPVGESCGKEDGYKDDRGWGQVKEGERGHEVERELSADRAAGYEDSEDGRLSEKRRSGREKIRWGKSDREEASEMFEGEDDDRFDGAWDEVEDKRISGKTSDKVEERGGKRGGRDRGRGERNELFKEEDPEPFKGRERNKGCERTDSKWDESEEGKAGGRSKRSREDDRRDRSRGKERGDAVQDDYEDGTKASVRVREDSRADRQQLRSERADDWVELESGTRSNGKQGRAKRRYLPGKNTAAYALLITLLRAHRAGEEFMRKQELIDAAEKSGLSRKPIIPPKSLIWTRQPRSGANFYSGWSTMNSLVTKGLVVKASNPAKYMLTEEGKITAQECIEKSGLVRETGQEPCSESEEDIRRAPDARVCRGASLSEDEEGPDFITADIQENIRPGQSQNQERRHKSSYQSTYPQANPAYPVSSSNARQDMAVVLSSSRHSATANLNGIGPAATSTDTAAKSVVDKSASQSSRQPSFMAQEKAFSSVSSTDPQNDLAIPPLKIGEKFCDVYDVICILDRREQFRRGSSGSHLQKFADRLETQFGIQVETRQVPVGDAIWIARHKHTLEEYVLDFVIERKAVDDLWQSIKDHRYKNQKLRLLKSGLKRLIYLVEGDVNMIDSTGSCKTAIFSTEIADGFHVVRTTDTNDTLKQYGHLTLAIKNRYQAEVGKRGNEAGASCKTYPDFVEHCKDLDRDRVTDIFCLQLMQINHVTEDVALSIQDRYPTIYSLVQAYTKLEGNVAAQEKLLQGIPIRGSSRTITPVLSKNVYKLVWAS